MSEQDDEKASGRLRKRTWGETLELAARLVELVLSATAEEVTNRGAIHAELRKCLAPAAECSAITLG